MTKRILVAYDGTPQSDAALEFAIDEWGDQEVALVYVINPVEAGYGASVGIPSGSEEWFVQAKAKANALFEDVETAYDAELTCLTGVGKPSQTIVSFASGEAEDVAEPFDHLVIGSHGRTGVSRMLLGSVAEKVVRESSIPVTVVR